MRTRLEISRELASIAQAGLAFTQDPFDNERFVVRARAVTSVLDRDQAGFPPHPHAIYKLTFLCDLIGGAARTSIESTPA